MRIVLHVDTEALAAIPVLDRVADQFFLLLASAQSAEYEVPKATRGMRDLVANAISAPDGDAERAFRLPRLDRFAQQGLVHASVRKPVGEPDHCTLRALGR